ncbi:MAG: class I SAM-dependent methyltransferase [Bacteroidales bacterium]|nr:class I SAM-dependent methyltransferase [Bacteroidales bacterium]
MELCPLCNTLSETFHTVKEKVYYQCPNCRGIFLERHYLPGEDDEITRYKEHNNDVDDERYQKFTGPVVKAVLRDFLPEHRGLDFGAGTGPVISKMLKDKNFQIAQYDPFFYNDPGLLKTRYDYIVCCEVIEHFHRPLKEFALLKSLLRHKGKLYCMTDIYRDEIDFRTWYYKADPTHVFFYMKETLVFIKENFDFSRLEVSDRLIIFSD